MPPRGHELCLLFFILRETSAVNTRVAHECGLPQVTGRSGSGACHGRRAAAGYWVRVQGACLGRAWPRLTETGCSVLSTSVPLGSTLGMGAC